MRLSHAGPFREQVRFLQRQFLQDGDLPFTNVLTEQVIARADRRSAAGWTGSFSRSSRCGSFWDRSSVPTTPAARRCPPARPSPGPGTTSVLPRDRGLLPGPQAPARGVLRRCRPPHGTGLGCRGRSAVVWKRRRVYVYDGSSVSMPDTPENQAEYPQPDTQKPGLGFPLARIAAIFSLACGAVLDVGSAATPARGKASWDCSAPLGPVSSWRHPAGRSPDVRWTEMVMLKQRGVDSVCRLTSHRKADFRRGQRLGQAITWSNGGNQGSLGRSTGRPTKRCPNS